MSGEKKTAPAPPDFRKDGLKMRPQSTAASLMDWFRSWTTRLSRPRHGHSRR